jgi:hypothetical protein
VLDVILAVAISGDLRMIDGRNSYGSPTTANAETFAQPRLLFWPFQRLESRRVNNGRLPAELGTRDSHCEARRIFLLKSIFYLV